MPDKTEDEIAKQRWFQNKVAAVVALGKGSDDAREFLIVLGIAAGIWINHWPEAERDKCLAKHSELVRKVMMAGPGQTGDGIK